jgi:hypothetical protein
LTIKLTSKLLEEHGMKPGEVVLVPRPTPLPTDLVGWLKTFARNTFFTSYSDEDAQMMMEEVAEICRPDAYWHTAAPGAGTKPEQNAAGEEGWEIMYVRIRGVAVLK